MEVTLQIRSTDGERQTLMTGDLLTIGRGEAADLRLDDRGLSRVHASLRRDGDRVWVEDQGSVNGTFVNGRPVTSGGAALADGDEIRLGGDTMIRIRIARQAERSVAPAPASSGGTRWPVVVAVIATLTFLGGAAALGLHLKNRWAEARSKDSGNAEIAPVSSPQPSSERASERASVRGTPEPTMSPEGLAPAPSPTPKFYLDMNDEQRFSFIDEQAQRITRMMGSRGAYFDRQSLEFIKSYVDSYSKRVGTGATRLWGEDLHLLFKRAQRYAPQIIREFNREGVGQVVGLYIPVIESEYQECLVSPVGAKGMFQFMPDTAIGYGIPRDAVHRDASRDARCDVSLMARAAALYMKDRIVEFGPDAQSVALGIAGYNRSPDSVRRDLQKVVNSINNERSFWTLISQKEELDRFFRNENVKYVPKFFAAAIVGENPWAFKLDMKPLSTYQ